MWAKKQRIFGQLSRPANRFLQQFYFFCVILTEVKSVGRQCGYKSHCDDLTGLQKLRRHQLPVGAMPDGRGPSKRPRRFFFLLAGHQSSRTPTGCALT
jgi:hypothetical protein